VDLPADQVQIFWLAQAMGPHLSVSAKRKFSIKVEPSTRRLSLFLSWMLLSAWRCQRSQCLEVLRGLFGNGCWSSNINLPKSTQEKKQVPVRWM